MRKLKLMLLTLACVSLAACASSHTTGREEYKNYGERIDDTKILTLVKTKLYRDPSIPNQSIHISIDRGIVQLSGFVKSHSEADLAVINARNTPGVKDVINSLIILSSSEYATRRGVMELNAVPRY